MPLDCTCDPQDDCPEYCGPCAYCDAASRLINEAEAAAEASFVWALENGLDEELEEEARMVL